MLLILNDFVWINLWDCYHDPRSSSRSKSMVILVFRLQFPFPLLLFCFNGLRHITVCTVTYHHACNMVMIEAILCAVSLSLCYTATFYGIGECIGSCWCMRDSKYKDSIVYIQAERKPIWWRRPSLSCCFHEDYNIMVCRICINRLWLVGGKTIILIGFPLLHMYIWCQSTVVDTN